MDSSSCRSRQTAVLNQDTDMIIESDSCIFEGSDVIMSNDDEIISWAAPKQIEDGVI